MVDGKAGKGEKYRPLDQEKWDEGWKKAFGNFKKKPLEKKLEEKKETKNE